MKMPMRLVKEVPEIYVDQSRDMQLLLRLMDCVYGGVKFDIDSVLNLTRTDQCKSNYLQLLQSKVGFLSDKKFDLEDLRLALSAFPWLVKNKGSKKAIKQAVNAYLKMRHIKADFDVNVYNEKGFSSSLPNQYEEVRYIESTDKQWIDTGIELTKNDNFSFKFRIEPLKENQRYFVLSNYGISSQNVSCEIYTDSKGRFYMQGGLINFFTNNRFSKNIINNVVYNYNNHIPSIILNDTITSDTETTLTLDFPLNSSLRLFRDYSADSSGRFSPYLRLYKCSMIINNSLVRDFIPCIRRTDRKPGLYDTVSKEFFVNANITGDDFSYSGFNHKPSIVQIGIEGNIGNTTILDEIFKYILPTGYEVEYVQYEQPETNAVELAYNDSIDYIIPLSGDNQTVGYTNENLLTYYGNPTHGHSGTAYGITFELKDDNRFVASGTTTAGGTIFLFYGNSWNSNNPALNTQTLPAGVYTLSVKGLLSGGVLSGWNYTKKEYLFQNFTSAGSKTFELSEETSVAIARNAGHANLVFNDDFYIKLEKGSTATPYYAPGERVDLMQSVGTQNLLEKEN